MVIKNILQELNQFYTFLKYIVINTVQFGILNCLNGFFSILCLMKSRTCDAFNFDLCGNSKSILYFN